MTDNVSTLKSLIAGALTAIAEEKGTDPALIGEIHLERPKQADHGDWATNAAMKNCKALGMKPRDLADEILRRIGSDRHIRSVEVAGPGFINFYLSNLWIGDVARDVLTRGDDYGRVDLGKGLKAQVEFVSSNPTGPLHVGHGRGAAVGDITASILAFAGWDVQREYYVNDAGLQINILGASTQSRYFELLGQPEKAPFPEPSYKGHYIYDVAQEIIDAHGTEFLDKPLEESLPFFKEYSARVILEDMKKDLKRFGVVFDNYYSEKSLYTRGLVESANKHLQDLGQLYEKEGALWFRSTEYGDDKDRVLTRSNGVPTYFDSDIAYHKDKFDRGFDRVIDVWGADHHGYVPRMKAAVQAMGYNPDNFTILLIQFVNLLRNGVQVPMSTRAGQFVTLKEVLDEVGTDAARYYFVMRRHDSHLDFDLEVAKSQSADNPVYYVQYAHARMCSMLSKAAEKGVPMPDLSIFDPELITGAEEKRLFTRMSQFSEEVARAAADLEPHRIVNYAYELAGEFHSYYNNSSRILEESGSLQGTHLLMIAAARQVLRNALKLLGISAPEKM